MGNSIKIANQKLIIACKDNDIKSVEKLLKVDGIDVNKQNNDGWAALMLACENNNIEIVKLLLKVVDIDVNIIDRWGEHALMGVCRENNIEIVKMLLEVGGIDVNKSNKLGMTALILACMYSNIEIVKLLLKVGGIDVNKSNKLGLTALITACVYKNNQIIELLLSSKKICINNDDEGKHGFHAIKYMNEHYKINYIDFLFKSGYYTINSNLPKDNLLVSTKNIKNIEYATLFFGNFITFKSENTNSLINEFSSIKVVSLKLLILRVIKSKKLESQINKKVIKIPSRYPKLLLNPPSLDQEIRKKNKRKFINY